MPLTTEMQEPRGSSSPKSRRNDRSSNRVSSTCDYSLAILKKFSADARVTGVVRSEQSKLVKLCPGMQCIGHSQIAALTALRAAFPFCAVTAVECASSGNTEFQILVSTDSESFSYAKQHYSQTSVFRALRILSNTSLVVSILCFVCLLHAAAIRPSSDNDS